MKRLDLTSPVFRRAAMLLAGIAVAAYESEAKSAPPTGATSHPDSPPAAATQSADPMSLAGPKYELLRYSEDFSYLDGPEGSYRKDPFDPIKYIHLGKDWTLRLGGEIRLRMESETNRNFGTRDPSNDTFLLHRYLLHADLDYRQLFRVFIEGVDARVEDRDLPQIPGMENTFDIHQLFTDFRFPGEERPLTLRAGRQEMIYGKERLIGKLDWMNETRRFDGVKLMYNTKPLDLDVFWVKPVVFMSRPYSNPWNTHINEGMNRKIDHWREEQHLYGAYATYKSIPNHIVDLYFLGLNDRGFFVNANNRFGDLDVYTIGSRFAGRTGGFDYDVEGAGQWGKWDGDEIHAWMFAADGGYTFKDVPMKPRIGVGFDYASGDDTPGDRSHDTFNQLYPTGHAFLGYMDLVGRQNIISPNVNFTLKPHKDVTLQTYYYHFWLDSDRDALYNAGGLPTRRNMAGAFGGDVGDELDVTVKWQVDAHSAFLVGWSHFWPDNFIGGTGASRDADFIYVQYQLRF